MLHANLMNGTDVRMVQSGSGSCFALKALLCNSIIRDVIVEEFEGNEAPQLRVLGLVHHTHSPVTEPLENAVMGDSPAD